MYIYSWKKLIKFWPILVIQLSKGIFFLMHVFTQSIVKSAPQGLKMPKKSQINEYSDTWSTI